jgi:hypothetical protein
MASEISGHVTVAVVFDAPTAVVCRNVRTEIGVGPCGEILPYIPLLTCEMEISQRMGRRVLQRVFESTFGRPTMLRCIISEDGALWWQLVCRKLLREVSEKVLEMCRPHLYHGCPSASSAQAMYLGPSPRKFRSTTRCQEGIRIAEPALVRIDPSTSAITEFLLKSPVPVDSVH